MTDNFDWQKDEEGGWTEPDKPTNSLPLRTRYKRFYIAAGLILLFLIPIVVFSLFFFQRRIEQVTDAVESEIRSTHLVLLEAVNLGDYDLIDSLLPNEDPQIRETLLNQIDRHLLIDRKSLGLVSEFQVEELKKRSAITITMSPDFTSAEVKSILPFRASLLDEPNNLVNLVTTLSYRREGEQWVASLLEDENSYWGEWVKLNNDILTISVPSIDEDIAQEMLLPLSHLTESICASPEVNCPRYFHLEFHFDRQQESIIRLRDDYHPYLRINPFGERYFLSLPTPTIIGRPLDAAGQEALYRGYGSWLVLSLAAKFTDLPDEDRDGLSLALLQRNDLKVPPRPQAVLPRTPTELPRSNAELPSEDLLLLCSNRFAINLLRLNLRSAVWSDEWNSLAMPLNSLLTNYDGAYVTAVPSHAGALIHVNSFDEGQSQWQSYWWHDSSMLLLIDDDEPYDVYPPILRRDIHRIGRFVRFVPDAQSGGIKELTTAWFDLAQCLAGPCEIQKAVGYPIWSPDESQTLSVMVNGEWQLTLFRGDKNAQPIEYLGFGTSPFWIDESTYGYVRPSQVAVDGQIVEDAGNEIVVLSIPKDSEMSSVIKEVVHAKFFQDVLPVAKQPGPLQIVSVMPYPRNPEQLIVAASSIQELPANNSYLFGLDIGSQGLSLILDLGDVSLDSLSMPMLQSPDGRYLAFVTYRDGDTNFYIHDYENGRMTKSDHSLPVDWTNDGQWLLFFESEKMVLFSPDTDQEIDIPININGCSSAVFISEDR